MCLSPNKMSQYIPANSINLHPQPEYQGSRFIFLNCYKKELYEQFSGVGPGVGTDTAEEHDATKYNCNSEIFIKSQRKW